MESPKRTKHVLLADSDSMDVTQASGTIWYCDVEYIYINCFVYCLHHRTHNVRALRKHSLCPLPNYPIRSVCECVCIWQTHASHHLHWKRTNKLCLYVWSRRPWKCKRFVECICLGCSRCYCCFVLISNRLIDIVHRNIANGLWCRAAPL